VKTIEKCSAKNTQSNILSPFTEVAFEKNYISIQSDVAVVAIVNGLGDF